MFLQCHYELAVCQDVLIIYVTPAVYYTSVATWSAVKESLLVSFSRSTTSTAGVAANTCGILVARFINYPILVCILLTMAWMILVRPCSIAVNNISLASSITLRISS